MRDSLVTGTRVAMVVLGALLTLTSPTAPASPSPLADNRSEVTPDGLHRVPDSALPLAWRKPGVDFKRYRKILFVADGMTFKGRLSEADEEFPISYEQKAMLNRMVLEVFTEELGKSKRFALAARPGKDVMVVRGALLDVVSHVGPPAPAVEGEPAPAPKAIGEATLVVELQDSRTGQFLARGVDRREALAALMRSPNGKGNPAELRRVTREWASELRHRLDAL